MQIKIISLGEIVTPDIMKTIQAFTALIAAKNPSSNAAEIGKAIGGVLQANMGRINDFKSGHINEQDFTDAMITAIENATQIQLTHAEFDQAWQAMHPLFSQFEAALRQAIAFNNVPGQTVIFISATNPKDMRNLIEQLKLNNLDHAVEDNQLVTIGGISLFCTHIAKMTKDGLIESVIKGLHPTSSSTLFSVGNPPGIEYIRSVSRLTDPVLQADLDRTNQQIEGKAAQFSVATIIWDKSKQQSLADLLNSINPVRIRLAANNL